MYEQLDRMTLKAQADNLKRELREARWAKEAAHRKQDKRANHSIEAGIVSVLVNAFNIR